MNHLSHPLVEKPSRRTILAATLAASLALIDRARAAESRTISLGFSTYGLKSLATEEAISTLAKIGFDAVEIAGLTGWDADPAKLPADRRATIRKRLADTSMKVSALMDNLPPQESDAKHAAGIERLKAAAQLAHDLSPDQPPLIETVLGGKDWEKSKPLFIKRLPDWVKLADSLDVTIAVKPHRGSAMSRPEEAVELMTALGNPKRLRLVYDYSHYVGRDMPVDQTIRALLPYTVFISIKDCETVNGKEVFKLAGETGQIDYAAILKQVYAGGYSGDFNCEVSSMIWNKPGYNGIESAKKCYAAIAPAFTTAGVPRPTK